jgi:hypothetical protein
LAYRDATDLAERCAQELALRRKPMTFGMTILTAAIDPNLIGALANSLFNILHLFCSVETPATIERAGGRYAAGSAEATAGPASGSTALLVKS